MAIIEPLMVGTGRCGSDWRMRRCCRRLRTQSHVRLQVPLSSRWLPVSQSCGAVPLAAVLWPPGVVALAAAAAHDEERRRLRSAGPVRGRRRVAAELVKAAGEPVGGDGAGPALPVR